MTDTRAARPRLKHAMTATAFGLVQIRQAWRVYLQGLRAEWRANAHRQVRSR